MTVGPTQEPEGTAPATVAARLAFYQRAGGIFTPLITALVAFVVGGLVVLVTGHNPLSAYGAIFDGTGLNWLFPWVTGAARSDAARNLQQTLLLVTPLILTGLAVAFSFRCGLFNIGGQGQYTVGAITGVWVASSLHGVPGLPHILLAILLASLAGAAWAGIAGLLKAAVGTHEVISTIMLNWIAYWLGSYLFALGGPLQSSTQTSVPVSNSVAENTHLHVFWGDPALQGLHVGLFVALAAVLVFWVVLNRTTLGYKVRAVGLNPEAARYGGISVPRSYFVAMAISGLFAGLAGVIDVLGWEFKLDVNDIQGGTTAQLGFLGIAVALLGRNTAAGVFLSALLFGSLLNGTSTRNPGLSSFRPDLANNLTLIIQGLIVLFVGADLLVLYLWKAGRKLPFRRAPVREASG